MGRVDWVITGLGAVIVISVLWDIFHTLWHTSGQGKIAHFVLIVVWKATALFGRRGRALSGPIAMIGVIGTWGGLIVFGWACIYYPHMPDAMSYEVGLDPDRPGQAIDALYFSLVTLGTLGYGDIVPTAEWLRVITPFEALIGFGLLTAAVSWVLQVYPALSRRRVLALRIDILARQDFVGQLHGLSAETAARTVDELAVGLAQVRIDLDQYAETYYFRDGTEHSNLADKLGYLTEIIDAARESPHVDVRLAGNILNDALIKLAELIDEQFVRTDGTVAETLRVYAQQQRV